jgi:hypothetical protein
MQQIQTYSISAPGFYGLNTQDSSLDLSQGFALVANNCVIDKFGRVGARKGWTAQHTAIGAMGSESIQMISEHTTDDGTHYVICAGNNKLFKLSGGVLTELTYGGGGTAPTITNSNWQTVSLGGDLYLFQRGHDPLEFSSPWSTTQYRRISEQPGYTGIVQQANCAISAFGRVWNADTLTDKSIVQWSDIASPQKYGSGTGSAGTLDVTQVWPNGNDTITALAAHNNFLFIFGKNCILVYNNANILISDPTSGITGMSLVDTITGIGCIARDSVQYTGTDVLFLSSTGVRSIMRTIQEKSAPLRDLSKNVRTDLMSAVAGENLENIKSVYNPFESFYLLTLPVLKSTYCFDLKQSLQDGSARVTTWDGASTSFCFLRDNTMLMGKPLYVGLYDSYQDNGVNYRFQYFTNHTDFGAPSVTSILKKLSVVVVGGTNQFVTMKWGYDFTGSYSAQNVLIPAQGVSYYGVAEYNTAAEYTDGTALLTLVAYPTGSGKVVQMGYESDISGSALSIQKIEIQAKNGKIV